MDLRVGHRATEDTEDYGKAELPSYDSTDLKRISDQNNRTTVFLFYTAELRGVEVWNSKPP